MEEYTFDLLGGNGRRAVVTVEADSYEEAEAAIREIRDRDFTDHEIEDHA